MDVETLTSLLVSIGWIGRKLVKENYMSNPSRSTMSYVKFTTAIVTSIAMHEHCGHLITNYQCCHRWFERETKGWLGVWQNWLVFEKIHLHDNGSGCWGILKNPNSFVSFYIWASAHLLGQLKSMAALTSFGQQRFVLKNPVPFWCGILKKTCKSKNSKDLWLKKIWGIWKRTREKRR